MAERRPPGFNVDLGFYDSEEVLSIPRKIRAAAVGVWTLCGAYSANKLSDGYVPAEALRDRGCTPAIRDALISTSPEPLWADARDGGIQFTRWAKWQRTSEEIKAFRDADAERKRKAREAQKQARDAHVDDTCDLRSPVVDDTCGSRDDHVSDTYAPHDDHVPPDVCTTSAPRDDTEPPLYSDNSEMSGRTDDGHAQVVRLDPGNPRGRARPRQTETETETKELVPQLGRGGSGGIATKPRRRSPTRTQLPDGWHPNPEAIQRMRSQYPLLDLRAECEAFTNHHQAHGNVMADWTKAFWTWLGNTNKFGPNGKPVTANNAKPPHKMRVLAELAAKQRAVEESQAIEGRKELV